MTKTTEHLKQTWERQDKAQPAPARAPRQTADNEFDPLQHGTHQESDHNKPERAQKGAGKH